MMFVFRQESTESGSSESVSYRLHSNNISTTDCSQSHSCHGQSTSVSTDSSSHNQGSNNCVSHSTTGSPASRHDSSLSSDADDQPRYETLGKKDTKTDKHDGYEVVGNVSDPCYATINKKNDPGYEKLKNSLDVLDSEPNYESLSGKGPPSDADPNYERIGHDYASLNLQSDRSDDGYATVNKPYALVNLVMEDGSIEPPYESLNGVEPDYESVQYMGGRPEEPPYQKLADFESGAPSIP